jgi:hypothetical protein
MYDLWPRRNSSWPFVFVIPQSALESDMAKGQKKSNKEARKPKADKTKATVATGLFSKGSTSADTVPKGKG